MSDNKYNKAEVKFNNGNGACVCNQCGVILSYGFDHNDVERYCETCYNKLVEITDEEYELFAKLKKIWVHSVPEKSGLYFICGEAGNSDESGLPEYILVCPQMGADVTAVYKRELVGKSGQ